MIWRRFSGAGNSFFIADNITSIKIKETGRSQLAQKICNSFVNAKTDGLIVLEKKTGYDFEWDFYNNDGSEAEMCGNAARCVSLYYQKFIQPKNDLVFLTKAGKIEAKILSSEKVSVSMPKISVQTNIDGHFSVNTGVPHIVVQGPANLKTAQKLRPLPAPKGSNVTFLNGTDAVTYERGVEDFTKACGTGAVAAAALRYYLSGTKQSVITMPGGNLEIIIKDLESPATLIGNTQYDYSLNMERIHEKI
jgi:diaminopimelate epimerase